MTRRLLVDLLGFTGRRGGTETYARELLARLPHELPDVEWIALVNRHGAEAVRSFFPGKVVPVRWVGADRVSWALGTILSVGPAARRVGADLVWCPANFGPITRRPDRLVTVHDAIYHTGAGSLIARVIHTVTSWLMTQSAQQASSVVTVSHAAAKAISEHMGVPPSSITVVPNGSTPPTPPSGPWDAVESLGVRAGRRIVLSTGNRLPHKNFATLLRALAILPRHERPLTVVTGGGADDPLTSLRAELDLEKDVVLPGWVTSDELEALYAVADLYVCPSLEEGFGLPVVDALRRGVPVLANDIAVLREVGGDLAGYVDASQPDELAAGLLAAIDLPVDDGRAARIAWGERFSWESSARALAVLFRKHLNAPRVGRAAKAR